MRVVLALALALALALCLAACAAPAAEVPGRQQREVQVMLEVDGMVVVGDERYDLTRTERAVELGRALKQVAEGRPGDDPTLYLAARMGTPFEYVQRLMVVLETVGVEDYRLDRGR